jgi:hypothetical protein
MGNQPSGPSDTYIVKKTKKRENNQKQNNEKQNSQLQHNQKKINEKPKINKDNNHQVFLENNKEQYFRQQPPPPRRDQPIMNYNPEQNMRLQKPVHNQYEQDTQTKLREKTYANTALMERNMLADIYIDQNRNNDNNQNNNQNNKHKPLMMDYPSNSNNELTDPKKNFENIKFTPYNFTDEVQKYKTTLNDENTEFERAENERRNNFKKKQTEKEKYLNKQIELFEQKYDPWSILGLQNGDYDMDRIKKAYKKSALKYHPDRAGDKYKDMFQIITQSYIYLLKKAEERDGEQKKTSRPVIHSDYEDDINEAVENIYIDKDKFDLNQFNNIFEKYKVPSSYDKGYGDMAKENINAIKDDDQIFGKKFNNDVFNAHFNTSKSKKKGSNALIEYQDPSALESSMVNLNTTFLGGIDEIEDFGSVNSSNNLSYTDYKKAHVDETMLIDVNKVKYKTYNSIDHLENERSQLSFELSPEDRRRSEYLERKRVEDDNHRMQKQNQYDSMIEGQYRKINQRLIVHK